MASRPAIAFYGDIPAEFGATISRTPGVMPDAQTLVIREEDRLRVPAVADVTLLDGGIRYVLPRCRASAVDPLGPGKARLTVFDRRWRWKDGVLDMIANAIKRPTKETDENGNPVNGPSRSVVDLTTLSTSQKIAEQILIALGEPLYDLRGIAGYGFPEVIAEGQKPADVLLEIMERVGVESIIDNRDSIKFIPLQFSPELPANPRLLDRTEGYRLETGPDYWVFRGGPTLFQRDYLMEAVGKEQSGEIKPIDELSYAPKDGTWYDEDPRDFGGVDIKFRALARSCVFRWYRIKLPVNLPSPKLSEDTPQKVKTAFRKLLKVKEDERWRILPMRERQACHPADAPNDADEPPEAIVIGRYWMAGEAAMHNASPGEVNGDTRNHPNIVIEVPRTLDEKKGIIKFAEPIYELDEKFDKMIEPKLRIRVGLGLRDRERKAYLRHEWYFKGRAQPIGTLPSYIQDDSVHYVIWDQYEPTRERGRTNERQFSKAAVAAVQNKLDDVRPQRPETWQYDGMQLIEPGGRVRQVKYEYSEGTALTTTVTLDDPALPDAPTMAEQQLYRGVNSWIASQRRSRRRRAKDVPAGDA